MMLQKEWGLQTLFFFFAKITYAIMRGVNGMNKYRVIGWTKRFSFVWYFKSLKMAELFMNLKIFNRAQMYDMNTCRCIKIREKL